MKTQRIESGIKINEVEDRTALYCRYDGQVNPQSVYIWLDPIERTMGASYNAEIGNAVPSDVWHGLTRRYSLPGALTAEAANGVMSQIAPLAQRVCDGFEDVWDGNNTVGRLTEDAQDAEEDIREAIDRGVYTEDYVEVWDADEWFAETGEHNVRAEYGITASTTDDELDAIVERMEHDAAAENVDILDNADRFARQCRDNAVEVSNVN